MYMIILCEEEILKHCHLNVDRTISKIEEGYYKQKGGKMIKCEEDIMPLSEIKIIKNLLIDKEYIILGDYKYFIINKELYMELKEGN